MKRSDKDTPSAIVAAAMELDRQLVRFGELTQALKQAPLNSQKKIQQAARLFQDVSEVDTLISDLVQQLSNALTAARETQQAQVEVMQERAHDFAARTEILQQLMLDYGELGQSAAKLNGIVHQAAALPADDNASAAVKSVKLADVGALMESVVEQALRLAKESQSQDFQDVARLADSMGQQLLAARKKMSRVQRGLDPGEANL